MDPSGEQILFSTRQHWASMLDRRLLPHVAVIVASRWLDAHLIGNSVYGITLPWSHANINAALNLIWLIAFMWLGIALGCRALAWQFSKIYITESQFIYRFWPIQEDRIPLWAIQDVSIRKSGFGLVCGFGTLMVDSGRASEELPFIPDVDVVANALRPHRAMRQRVAGELLYPAER